MDKPVVVDSKVLMLATESIDEAYYIFAILNSQSIIDIIDAYAVNLNRGIDVLKNIRIPKFDTDNSLHTQISKNFEQIHEETKYDSDFRQLEKELEDLVELLY